MKIYTLIAPVALLLSMASFQASSEPISASEGWNSSIGYRSAYSKSVALTRADLMKKAKGGYYKGFNSYNYSFSSITAGNIVTFNNSTLENVSVDPMNCGNVASIDAVNSNGTEKVRVNGNNCTLGGRE